MKHLKLVVGEHLLTFIELSTLLCQIEACLHSRPITPILDNPSELYIRCLTSSFSTRRFLSQNQVSVTSESRLQNDGNWRLK